MFFCKLYEIISRINYPDFLSFKSDGTLPEFTDFAFMDVSSDLCNVPELSVKETLLRKGCMVVGHFVMAVWLATIFLVFVKYIFSYIISFNVGQTTGTPPPKVRSTVEYTLKYP